MRKATSQEYLLYIKFKKSCTSYFELLKNMIAHDCFLINTKSMDEARHMPLTSLAKNLQITNYIFAEPEKRAEIKRLLDEKLAGI